MKKIFSLLAVLALVVMAGKVWAADFSGPDKKTALAEIKSGVAEFSVDLYEWENTYSAITSTGTIHWDNLGDLTLFTGEDEFRCANVYALIKSTMTKANSTVYIFQDNRNNTDGHAATAAWKDGANDKTRYDGLVEKSGTKYAKLTYRCVKKADAKTDIKSLPNAWPSWESYDGVRAFNDPGNYNWDSMKTTNYCKIAGFVDSTHYGTLVSWHNNEGWTNYVHDDDVIMLFGAQFSYVQDGESYGTNTITFQNEIE